MQNKMQTLKKILETIIPAPLLRRILSFYHLSLSSAGAALYGYPAKKITVIGVTGTKGKSSTTEILNAIFEEAGNKTALINSIRIKVAGKSERNLLRMTMPGRIFLQKFLSDAVRAGCSVSIIEMTSEGARQHRHRFLELNALIFTNLAPEHIESHGSLRAYADAKFEIGRELARSRKRPRTIVANADDREGSRYLMLAVENSTPFSLTAVSPYHADEHGGYFTLEGEKLDVRL